MKTKTLLLHALQILGIAFIVTNSNSILASSVYIDASSGTPVISSNYLGFAPLGGATTVTPIIPGAWSITFSVAGTWAGFSSSNRGLELTNVNTGKLVDSFGVDYVSWSNSLDFTTVHAQLYTVDASGEITGRTPRVSNAFVSTAVEAPGTFQLAMAGMSTAYTSFDIYLKGAPHASPVPVPTAVWLFGSSLIGLIGFTRKNKAA